MKPSELFKEIYNIKCIACHDTGIAHYPNGDTYQCECPDDARIDKCFGGKLVIKK